MRRGPRYSSEEPENGAECRLHNKNRHLHQPQIAAGDSYRDTGPIGDGDNWSARPTTVVSQSESLLTDAGASV